MKKIFKTILFVSFIGILFSSQFVFAEKPSNLETDLQNIMELIRTGKQDEYVASYQKMLSTYSNRDLEQFKVIHLKYLFLNNSEKEFMNLLTEFPDNYVFDTYLQANNQKIEFADMLKHKKKMTKKDLVGIWSNLHEIDKRVSEAIKKDDYSNLLKMVNKQSEYDYSMEGVYSPIDGKWASTIGLRACFGHVVFPFIKDKYDLIVKYLIDKFNKFDSQENLVKLLSLDINVFDKKLDVSLYSPAEISSLKNTFKKIQNKQLPLQNISSIYRGAIDSGMAYSYEPDSESYLFYNKHYDHDLARIENFNKLSLEDLKIIALSKNFVAIELYSEDNYKIDYLIFKKDGAGWKPVIRYVWDSNPGDC